MQTTEIAKKHCRVIGEGIVAAVVVVAFALGCLADVDQTISAFAGIDVLGTQTNKAVSVKLPAAFGPFKDATSFADEKGHIHQIRCVAEYAKDVGQKKIIEEIDRLVPEIEKRFACSLISKVRDPVAECRWTFKFNADDGWSILAYVAESKTQGKSNGCHLADLTFFKGGLGVAPAAAGLGSFLTIEIRKGDGAAADGIILCDGHEVRRNDLDTRLREISRKSKKTPIVINAAAGSPHKTLVDVLDICYRNELFSVSIYTL